MAVIGSLPDFAEVGQNIQTRLTNLENKLTGGTVAQAVKASQDSEGNVISQTYATKAEINALIQRLSEIEAQYVSNTNPTVSGVLTIKE